jgi:hypothetical protein
MAVGYRVKTIKCESGERLPLLVNKVTGVPLWDPTLFILTELRATNLASNTIAQAARAVMVAHQVFDYLGINLNERLTHGRLLTMGEIDMLAKLAGFRQEELDTLLNNKAPVQVSTSRIVSLEKVRMRASGPAQKQVDSQTKATRLIYIRGYIAWVATGRLLKLDVSHQHYQALNDATQTMVGRINARIPGRDPDTSSRQGVSSEVRARILKCVTSWSLALGHRLCRKA